jgi:hypothetical protein
MSGNQGETKSGSAAPAVVIPHAPAVVIPQLNQAQSRALARGRTIGHYGHGVQPNPFTLRQRDVYEDERLSDGGGALYTARTQGVLRGIEEVGQHRVAAAPVIRAIGRRNLAHRLDPRLAGAAHISMDRTRATPPGPSRHIMGLAGEKIPISDLTKTFLGAPSKRKGKTRKNPRHQGGRRRKRRKTKRKRKRKTKRKSSKKRTTRSGKRRTRKRAQWTVLPKSGKCPKGYRKNIKQPGSKKKHFCITKQNITKKYIKFLI